MCILSVVAHGSPLFWVLVSSAFGAAGIFILSIIIKNRTKELLKGPAPEVQKDVIYSAVQIDELREMLGGTGYAYDWKQDVFYSVKNPWQKKFGYCRLYDEAAAPLGMIIDCEPIEFECGGKKWLIELWKGQYGMAAGAEIGIYNTSRSDLHIPGVFTGTLYQCAEEKEYMNMTYTLKKDGKTMFRRAAKHWWLTGFKLGVYAKPSSLTMEAAIKFTNPAMYDAFMRSLIRLGYGRKDIRTNGSTVLINFTKPHSRQPRTRGGLISRIALQQDKWFIREYRRLTKNTRNMYEVMMTLRERAPLLYTLALKVGRQREMFGQFDTLSQYLD